MSNQIWRDKMQRQAICLSTPDGDMSDCRAETIMWQQFQDSRAMLVRTWCKKYKIFFQKLQALWQFVPGPVN